METHYLEKELYTLVQADLSIFEFLQKGSLDGIWYWDLKNQENEWMSPRFWTTLGYDPKEKKHLASEWQDLIHPEDLQLALDNFKKHCADPNHPYDQVVRYRHKDGSTVWVRCRGIAIRDKTGKPIRLLGAHTDLTLQKQAEYFLQKAHENLEARIQERTSELREINEQLQQELRARTKAEKALRESEEKYRGLFESSFDGIAESTLEGSIITCNSAYANMAGYSEKEIKKLKYQDLTPLEWAEVDKKHVQQCLERGYSDLYEKERICKDGTVFPISIRIWLRKDERGNPLSFWGIVRDISDRRRTENLLRESEKRFRGIIESTQAGYFFIDKDGFFQDVNKSWLRMHHYSSPDEVIGQHFSLTQTDPDLEAAHEIIKRLPDKEPVPSGEFSRRCKDGTIGYHTFTVNPVVLSGEIIGLEGFIIDITTHKEAEETLKKERDRSQQYLDLAAVMFVSLDVDQKVILINRKGCEVLGYSEDEIIGKNWFDHFLPKTNITEVKEVYNKILSGNLEPVEYYENPVLTSDGSEKLIAWHNSIIRDESGRIIGLLSSGEDITERKLAEGALRESEEKLRAILEANPDPVVMYDTEGHPQYLNPAFTEVFGWTIDELKGQRIPFVPHDQKEINAAKIKEIYVLGKTTRIETQRLTKQGDTIDVSVSAAGIKGPNGKIVGMVVNLTDITQKKKIERQLQRFQKMESLGLLAGGVAHDLNNVLSGFVSYPELLLLELPEDSKLRRPIESMKKSGHRAVAIVQDLLTVARGVATTKEPLSINDIVRDYLHSPEFHKFKEFYPAVTIQTNLDNDLLNIAGSHVHTRKVIMNLVTNASEAIEGSGNVVISTVNRYIDKPLRGYDDVKTGEYAVLAVSDDGSGISSEDLERIFEPLQIIGFAIKDELKK